MIYFHWYHNVILSRLYISYTTFPLYIIIYLQKQEYSIHYIPSTSYFIPLLLYIPSIYSIYIPYIFDSMYIYIYVYYTYIYICIYHISHSTKMVSLIPMFLFFANDRRCSEHPRHGRPVRLGGRCVCHVHGGGGWRRRDEIQ